MSDKAHDISLEQAKELVSLLEEGKQQQANQLLEDVYNRRNDKLFTSVGQLTRDLHEALQDFQLDPRIVQMTEDDLPDAQNRLQYVIQKTEDAANRTMDAVEACLPMADDMHQRVESVMPVWNRLMSNDIQLNEFKSLCHEVDDVLKRCGENMPQVHGLMTEVLMAQIIKTLLGRSFDGLARREAEKAESSKQKNGSEAEGPIIDADKRDDVVGGQDEVDDLLSSLGF